jgi:hypothetical protein
MPLPVVITGAAIGLAVAFYTENKRKAETGVPGAGAEGLVGGERDGVGGTMSMTSNGQPISFNQTDAGPMPSESEEDMGDKPLPEQVPLNPAAAETIRSAGASVGAAIAGVGSSATEASVKVPPASSPGASAGSAIGSNLAQRLAAPAPKPAPTPVLQIGLRGLSKNAASSRIQTVNAKTRMLVY